MKSVLLVDDEIEILMLNKNYLEKKGLQVGCAKNKTELIECLKDKEYDCIVLDILMKETNGYDLCRFIKKSCASPVIFLTSLTSDESQIEGFISGGDDYMTKPYNLNLLWLRIRARMNDVTLKEETRIITSEPLLVNLDARDARINDLPIILTAIEFDILSFLMVHEMEVFSLSEIYCHVWKQDDMNRPSTAQVHISNLRSKLEKASPKHRFIHTSWGKGYYFKNEILVD